MSDYQQVHLDKCFNLSRHFVMLYGVSFHEPASRLLSPPVNATSSYPRYFRTAFVNTTLAVQLTEASRSTSKGLPSSPLAILPV